MVRIKEILRHIPFLPLSAVLFVIAIFILSSTGIIPSTSEILILLGEIYKKFGILGVFIASFLEGIVYLGLYFPGSMIIVMSLFVSGGSLIEYFKIALTVGLAFTLTATINYSLGFSLSKKKQPEKTGKFLFFSLLHPHFISFYFFNEGLLKNKPFKIIIVPFFIVAYIFILASILYPIGGLATKTLGDPINLILLMFTWFLAALVLNIKKEITTQKEIKNYIAKTLSS